MSKKSTLGGRSVLSRAGLWGIAGVLASIFLMIHLRNLNESYLEFKWDGIALGNNAHLLWSLAQGLPPTAVSGAATEWFNIPAVLYALAPIYHVWPSPLFLLTVQTAALAAAAGAVFFLGSQYLSRVRALILALFFCFYPPIYTMSSASFHPAILAVPFLTLLILAALRGERGRIFLFFACSLVCDLRTGLLASFIFLWLARRSGDRRWWMAAGVACAAGLAGLALLRTQEGMGPFIFFGALTAPYLFWIFSAFENWIDRALSKRSILLTALSPIFFAGAVFASAMMTPALMSVHPGVSQLPVRKSAVNALIERIPADAEVVTTPLFLPRMSNRANVALIGDMPADAPSGKAARYALVDLSRSEADTQAAGETVAALRELVRRGWGPVASAGGVVLFSERPGKDLRPLYATVSRSEDRPFLALQAKTWGPVELTGFTMLPDDADGDIIRFSFYWKKNQTASIDYAVQLEVVDAQGQSVYSMDRRLCYGLYPFSDWRKDESVRDEFLFVVPERLQNSSYEVRLSLRRLPDFVPVRMDSPVAGAVDDQGRIRLIALDAI